MDHIHYALPKSRVDREAYVINKARGKRVLHLGAADTPYTWEAINAGTWLHQKLTDVASACVGLDLDAETVTRLRHDHRVTNLVVGNCEALSPELLGQFDLIVAGEMIEHLNNPGLFLESARGVLAPGGELLVTTINAFCLRRFLRIPFGTESVHPDHTYYFSHCTLNTLVRRFGYELIEAHGYALNTAKKSYITIIEELGALLSPNLCQGLVHLYRVA